MIKVTVDPIMDMARPITVQCKDGSSDVRNGIVAPCTTKGGVMGEGVASPQNPIDTTQAVDSVVTTATPKLTETLLGKNDGFGTARASKLLLYVAGGGIAGFFASKPLKVSKVIGTVMGVGVVLVFFAGLNAYENIKDKK